jgi:hypothetical protein
MPFAEASELNVAWDIGVGKVFPENLGGCFLRAALLKNVGPSLPMPVPRIF